MSHFNSAPTGKLERRDGRSVGGIHPLASGSLTIICYLYVISLFIAVPYYNWQYARGHGFADWLFWGEIVPTGKAFVWPYFAVQSAKARAIDPAVAQLSQRQVNQMQIMSADRAIAAALQGNYIINSREPGSALSSEQLQSVVASSLRSLQSADTTDEGALNKLYPEFGTRFKRDFCESQRRLVSGLRNGSRDDLARSSELDRVWKDWYNENRKQIEDAFNLALQ
jgi:hypothetical protein